MPPEAWGEAREAAAVALKEGTTDWSKYSKNLNTTWSSIADGVQATNLAAVDSTELAEAARWVQQESRMTADLAELFRNQTAFLMAQAADPDATMTDLEKLMAENLAKLNDLKQEVSEVEKSEGIDPNAYAGYGASTSEVP
ncbi:unnamed protein product [Polarella glacialis]|uniref:Uncharacterized protein n=1 Tax=Polarella glacialis TaxID=89957 RepID=A0A813HRJ1_POLGL|nr:unnamed protein product [Polarella glacialis]